MLRAFDTYVNALFQLLVNGLKRIGFSVPTLLLVLYTLSAAAFIVSLYDGAGKGVLPHYGIVLLASFASFACVLAIGVLKELMVTRSKDVEASSAVRRDKRLALVKMGTNAPFRFLGLCYSLVYLCWGINVGDLGLLLFGVGWSSFTIGVYIETCL